ncbi:hypothetical protein [Xenophilus sp. Marseille-Q4582]|uniref:hypothetical protein n=1 Tax=Xenophilus sp. Marseille-Q4582 TaxID=2866600 RepID=UPI001CE3D98A|nr:hypothetical protein [Xenophilus sp. Marseille-Q4582]
MNESESIRTALAVAQAAFELNVALMDKLVKLGVMTDSDALQAVQSARRSLELSGHESALRSSVMLELLEDRMTGQGDHQQGPTPG